MELSKSELIRLLSFMEANLQATEIVIAALKSERLRKIFFPPIFQKCSDLAFRNNSKKKSNNYATIIPSKLQQIEQTNNNEEKCEFNKNIITNDLKNISNKTFNNNLNNLNDNYNLKWQNYQDYQNQLNSSPLLALSRDFNLTHESNNNESLTKAIVSNQLYRLKKLVKDLLESKCSLQSQLEDLNEKYLEAFKQLEEERSKNSKFQHDKTLHKLEELDKEKKIIEDELNALKKTFEEEHEREKVMIIYLLSERKQLIIRLIEENDRNSELTNLLNKEKNRSAEMEEGLEEESKRSLQMEIDLELLSNKYETEKAQLEEKIRNIQAKNLELSLECDKLREKCNDSIKSSKPLSNNQKVLTDLGEGVRSTVVTLNNTIPNNLNNSKTVISSQRAIFSVVQSNIHPKPSIANKPNLENINSNTSNNKPSITTVNKSNNSFNLLYSTIQPMRTATIRNTDNTQPINTKPTSINKLNTTTQQQQSSVINSNTPNISINSINDRTSPTVNNTNISTTSTSVASVIQKFSNCTLTSKNVPPPPFKKPQTTALIAGLAQSIGQSTTRSIPAPPIPPNKPMLTHQFLKERTSKLIDQKTTNTNSINSQVKN